MKRIISILLVFVMTASLLVGCGGSDRPSAKNAEEAVKQLDQYKNYDITATVDLSVKHGPRGEVEATLSVRKNGISLSAKGDVEGVEFDIKNAVMLINDKVYINVKDIEKLADEEIGMSRAVEEVLENVNDYVAIELPGGIDYSKIACRWIDIFRKGLVAGLEKADMDGHTITISDDDFLKIFKAVVKVVEAEAKSAGQYTADEVKTIDYIGVVKKTFDDVPKSLKEIGKIVGEDIADEYLEEFADELQDMEDSILDAIYDEFDTEDSKKINKEIAKYIDEAYDELIDDLEDVCDDIIDEAADAERYIKFSDIELEATATGGEFKLTGDVSEDGVRVDATLSIKESDGAVVVPQKCTEISASSFGAAMLVLVVELVSYRRYYYY